MIQDGKPPAVDLAGGSLLAGQRMTASSLCVLQLITTKEASSIGNL
jgi:hypothetical protein